MTRLDKFELASLAALVILVTSVGWMRVQSPRDMEQFDWWWYDRFAEFEPAQELIDNYVVVMVDDASLAALGENWPMSRAVWGKMLKQLAAGQARVVSIDAWFETPVPIPGLNVAETLFDDMDMLSEEQLGEDARAVLDNAADEMARIDVNTAMERAVAEAGNVLLGMACYHKVEATGPRPLPAWVPRLQENALQAKELDYPCLDLFTSYNALGVGAKGNMGLNASLDQDGTIRRYPLYFGYQDQILSNMATAVLGVVDREKWEPVTIAAAKRNRGLPLIRPFDVSRVKVIPLIHVFEASSPEVLRELFKDKRVLVGVSALGVEDLISMPGHHRIEGIFSHLTAALNAEHDAFIDTESSALTYSVIGSIVGVLLVALGMRKRSFPILFGVTIVCLGGYLGLAIWALNQGVLITGLPWTVGVFGVLAIQLVRKLVEGRANRQQVKRVTGAFEHYVAPEVIDVLLSDPEKLRLGGERQEITAFFSDVAGFTSLSEKVEPAVLVELLNQVLGDMTTIIIEEGGIVDKYIGDAVVAMFGAPVKHSDHATRSIRAAMRSQVRMDEIKKEWIERGLPPIRVRIGTNTGVAVVGNIGAANRFDYTMMGDTVNLAARLEGINNYYGSNVLVGEDTYAQAKDDFVFREIDRVRVKGKQQPISMYEPLAAVGESLDEHMTTIRESYAKGLEQYRNSEFQAAIETLEPLADAGDGPSKTILGRAREYAETPPPEDWGGVYTMTSK